MYHNAPLLTDEEGLVYVLEFDDHSFSAGDRNMPIYFGGTERSALINRKGADVCRIVDFDERSKKNKSFL